MPARSVSAASFVDHNEVGSMDPVHTALLKEIRRRLAAAKDDPNITNSDGSNYWGPYVTRAIDQREHDGPALVTYIKGVLRKPGESEGWNAMLEADRLDISFEDMVLNAEEPIRGLFDDEDRQIAAQLLGRQEGEIERRRDAIEAQEVERDRRIVADVGARRRAAGKPWTEEMEARMLAERAERRRGSK
ncbi:MAG: hypothetical protein ACYC0H_21005 [Solirubrobacteraceae bacterium]